MKTKCKKQTQTSDIDPIFEQYRMKRLGKNQLYLAKVLNRSKGAISQAFSGLSPTLLDRIKRHLDYLEKKSNKIKEHDNIINPVGSAISQSL